MAATADCSSHTSGERAAVAAFVTGFGSFNGVCDNPTARLAANLREVVAASDSSARKWSLEGCSVVHVSRRGCLETLDAMEAAAPDDRPSVFLHFGVANGAPCARLESTAYNLAHFRVPDESGEAPKSEKIMPEFDLGLACRTEFDCAAVAERLNNSAHKLAVSVDPGRFVCNFMAFSSMQRAAARNATGTASKRLAVFCHFPGLTELNEDAGLQLALDLLDALATEALSK